MCLCVCLAVYLCVCACVCVSGSAEEEQYDPCKIQGPTHKVQERSGSEIQDGHSGSERSERGERAGCRGLLHSRILDVLSVSVVD